MTAPFFEPGATLVLPLTGHGLKDPDAGHLETMLAQLGR